MKKKKHKRGYYVDKADKAFSIYIREKTRQRYQSDICPLCESVEIQCNFHWIHKAQGHSGRWLESNAIGACMGCNGLMERDAFKFFKWYKNNISPTKLDRVYRYIKRTTKKYSNLDLLDIEAKYQKKYNELNVDA